MKKDPATPHLLVKGLLFYRNCGIVPMSSPEWIGLSTSEIPRH